MAKSKTNTRVFKGRPVSPGIGIGRVHLLRFDSLEIPEYHLSEKQVSEELGRLKKALRKTQKELGRIQEKLCKFQVGNQIQILETHQMMTKDELLVAETRSLIQREKINAEWALDKTIRKLGASLEGDKSPYFKQRSEELLHVSRHILQNLMQAGETPPRKFIKNSVVIAHDLSPTDTAQMVKGVVQGFVTESGGPDSHTAIIARALEIPAVVGVEGLTRHVQEGDTVLLDGSEGTVILKPTPREHARYLEIRRKYERFERRFLKEAHLPSVTRDGFRLRLAANMELVEEIPSIKRCGAEGIGLFRTELISLTQGRHPSEEEQFEIYRHVLRKLWPQAVTIRTFDIGSEKSFPGGDDAVDDLNPALGLRAIRYCLKEKEIFRHQLKALLRASNYGSLKILIPMVTNLEEIRQTKKILHDIQKEFLEKRISFNPAVKLGAMVEVPSAALMADELASEVDFLSVGTNDLTQYTLAVDRTNEDVTHLYEPLHPSVLRLLKMVADSAKSRNIEVSVCGEMAGNPLCFMLLLGLGLSELSMNSVSIPRVKKLTRSVTFRQAHAILDRALGLKTAGEIEHFVKREASKIEGFPELE